MQPQHPHLSVVIPAYNESARIGKTLTQVRSYLDAQPYRSEVIVVDDGSTDNLMAVVEEHMKHSPYIKFIRYVHNRGKGHAVREGMQAARGDYRLFMDADNSVTIENVAKFIEAAQKGADVVIGSIMLPHQMGAHEHAGVHRVILRTISAWVRSLLININVYDTQRGFKLFSARAANTLFSLQRVERFGFDIELLALAQKFRFPIKELGVEWDNPDGSHVTLLSYPQSLLEVLSIRWNMLLRRYEI